MVAKLRLADEYDEFMKVGADPKSKLATPKLILSTLRDLECIVSNGAPSPQGAENTPGNDRLAPNFLDIETVAIRLDTVVSTLQILIEAMGQTDPNHGDALALLRDTVAEQSERLNELLKV